MKQQIVPTSPKSELPRQRNSHSFFVLIVLAVIFGTLSGLFGVLIGFNLLSYFPASESRDRLLFSSSRSEQSLITQAPEVVDQLASVYSAEPTIDAPSTWLGNAVAVTADGWYVLPTVQFAVTQTTATPVVELPTGKTVEIDESVEDAFTGMTFFHVDAELSDVVSFPETKHLTPGQTVSIITEQREEPVIYERVIAGTPFTSLAQSIGEAADIPVVDMANQTADTGVTTFMGAPAFYAGGNFAGIMVANSRMIPSQWIQGVLQSVLRTKTAVRTTLDLTTINADQLTTNERAELDIPEHGLYIQKGDGGLEEGDVITVINSVRVDVSTNLQDIIQSKPVGTTIYCIVIRDGVEMPLEVVL